MDENDLKQVEDIFARHIGILVENFQHKLDIVVEGHQVLYDKIDHVQQELTGLTARVDRIELVVLRLEQHQANLEQRQANLEQRQGNLEKTIEKVRKEIGEKIDHVAADLADHRADTEVHRTSAGKR